MGKEKNLVTSILSFSQNVFNAFTRRQILESSQLKEFADDYFKFDKMAESYQKG